MRQSRRAFGLALVSACAIGCTTSTPQRGARGPEAESDAELALARSEVRKGEGHGSLDVALEHVNKALALYVDNAAAHYYRSTILRLSCGQLPGYATSDCIHEAEASLRAALKAKPDLREARQSLGAVLGIEGRYADVIATLEPLTRDPAYAFPYAAWGSIGWAQVLDGQVDAGIVSLRNAIRLEPRACLEEYHLGLALEKKGELSRAEEALSIAVTIAPKDPWPCLVFRDALDAQTRLQRKLAEEYLDSMPKKD